MNKLDRISNKIRDKVASGTLPQLPLWIHHTPAQLRHFEPVSDAEAIAAIQKLSSKTSQMDFIPMTILKGCDDVFSTAICQARLLIVLQMQVPLYVQGWPRPTTTQVQD